jgi:hypothetical protein
MKPIGYVDHKSIPNDDGNCFELAHKILSEIMPPDEMYNLSHSTVRSAQRHFSQMRIAGALGSFMFKVRFKAKRRKRTISRRLRNERNYKRNLKSL